MQMMVMVCGFLVPCFQLNWAEICKLRSVICALARSATVRHIRQNFLIKALLRGCGGTCSSLKTIPEITVCLRPSITRHAVVRYIMTSFGVCRQLQHFIIVTTTKRTLTVHASHHTPALISLHSDIILIASSTSTFHIRKRKKKDTKK